MSEQEGLARMTSVPLTARRDTDSPEPTVGMRTGPSAPAPAEEGLCSACPPASSLLAGSRPGGPRDLGLGASHLPKRRELLLLREEGHPS